MTDLLLHDIQGLRSAMDCPSDVVEFSARLPKQVAQKVLQLLDGERKGGAYVISAPEEFRTTQAAAMLGVSRPHLSRMIEAGEIEARKVGSHWKIPSYAISNYWEQQTRLRQERVSAFMEAQAKLDLPD